MSKQAKRDLLDMLQGAAIGSVVILLAFAMSREHPGGAQQSGAEVAHLGSNGSAALASVDGGVR